MHNVATAAAVYRAVTRGEPVVSRYVTITGDVKTPRTLQVLLGTPALDCLKACGYEHDENHKVILGGPMMGIHIRDPNIPIIKTTNCLLVEENKPLPPEMPCIRCGDCVDVCPVNLLPQQLYWHARADNFEAARQHHLFDCIECGCCSYVCPSHIPLVQYYRYGKSRIAEQERRRSGADQARSRFLKRQSRLHGREAEEAAAVPADVEPGLEEKRAYIEAAVERTKMKRRGNNGNATGD